MLTFNVDLANVVCTTASLSRQMHFAMVGFRKLWVVWRFSLTYWINMNIERGDVWNQFLVSSVLVSLYSVTNVLSQIWRHLFGRAPFRPWGTGGPSSGSVSTVRLVVLPDGWIFYFVSSSFPPCRMSVVILRQRRTTDANSAYLRLICMKVWAVFREASPKSILIFYHTILKQRKLPPMTFQRCFKESAARYLLTFLLSLDLLKYLLWKILYSFS